MNVQGGKNQKRTTPSLPLVTVHQVATNQTAVNQSTRDQFDYTIYPSRARLNLPYKEIWESAELLYFLMWRDLKIRYKQAIIGLGWAVIKPLMLMVVFVVVFGIIARVPTGNMPYSVVVYTGLLPWTLVTTVVGTAASSLIANAHLLTRVYFPRLIMPLSASIVALIDLIISLPILFALLLWFHIPITARVLWLPLLLGMIFILSVSIGLIMAALHTKYHDVGMLLPILLQVWMYATPIIYPIELVPAKWLLVYSLNPLVGLIQGVRWALVDASIPTPFMVISSVAITLITLVGSVLFFQFAEDYFADVV